MKPPAITLIGLEKCVGCQACLAVCNFSGLKKITDKEGFLKVAVTDNCINCGVCAKVCPVLIQKESDMFEKPIVFGGWSLDEKVRKQSSSGGLFTELAKLVIREKGAVVGAILNNGVVNHKIVTSIEDLSLFRGSKYQQSQNLNLIYDEIKVLIKKGKRILFSGTPCQVVAIKNMISSPLLLTIDVVCLGFPSPLVMQKCFKEQYLSEEVIVSNYRSKEQEGWRNYFLTLSINKRNISVSHKKELFFRFFMTKLIISPACYSCQYNETPRFGDISLADFWGVKATKETEGGTSLILCNNLIGEKMLNTLKSEKIIHCFDSDLEEAEKGTWRVNSNKMGVSLNSRDSFFEDFESLSLKEMKQKYLKRNRILQIKGFLQRLIKK